MKWQQSPTRTLLNSVDLFNEFFNDFTSPALPKWNVPAVNVGENDQAFTLYLAAPGLKKEDFKITIEENTLSISFEQNQESAREIEKFSRKEYSIASFNRRFNIPEIVDQSAISAQYEQGVMTIILPKKQAERPSTREINVK